MDEITGSGLYVPWYIDIFLQYPSLVIAIPLLLIAGYAWWKMGRKR